MTQHLHWMQHALNLADQAQLHGEVPVGACIVHDNELIAEGYNQPISRHDPTAHAEIIAIRNACSKLKNYRLPKGSLLYVTLEPCAMCVGAMHHARISHLVFGANEPKFGCVVSNSKLLNEKCFNHAIEFTSGVLVEPCRSIIQVFFRRRRGRI